MRPHPALSGTTHKLLWQFIELERLLQLVEIRMQAVYFHSWQRAITQQ